MTKNNDTLIITLIGLALMCTAIYFLRMPLGLAKCEGPVWGSTELYYQKEYPGNVVEEYGFTDNSVCLTRNHTEDNLREQEHNTRRIQTNQKYLEEQNCYNQGYDINQTFDLLKDYNLSCAKISYFNDHLILGSEQKDGGHYNYDSTGFFNSVHISDQRYDWVNTENLARGNLLYTTREHLDCHNETIRPIGIKQDEDQGFNEWTNSWNDQYNIEITHEDTKKITTYMPSDFVNYYTNNCIH